MKTLNKELLGFSVPIVGVCETLEELLAACGSPERVVALANNYVLFHQHYTVARDAIVETLVKETGKPLESVTDEKTKKVTITEKDLEYVGRIEEEAGEGGLTQYEDAVSSAVSAISVDYTQPVRGTGTGAVVAKKWLAYYDEFVQKGKLDAFIAKYALDVEGLDEDGIKTAVAKKVKEVVTKATQAALASAGAL